MSSVTTMAFITHCYRRRWIDRVCRSFFALALLLLAGWTQAQSLTDISQFRVERVDEEIQASAQLVFELPPAVEDALFKGIALFFVVEVEISRERWYWSDKKMVGVERQMRLAYQPLTRRWRLSHTTGNGREPTLGLALSESFDSLAQALEAVKRISGWRLMDAAGLDAQLKYRAEMRFRLDLTRLPRPFQIGALGQTDWDLAATVVTSLTTGDVQ